MNSQNKKSSTAGFSILLTIPATFALVVLFSFTSLATRNNLQTPQQKPAEKTTIKFTPPKMTEKGDKPMENPDKSPQFKGGMQAMMKFLGTNLHYPPSAVKAKTQGTVFVQFVVEETGKIAKTKILRGISKECDAEAIRVVNSMPKWIPGREKGKAVPVMFQIPVKFQLAGK